MNDCTPRHTGVESKRKLEFGTAPMKTLKYWERNMHSYDLDDMIMENNKVPATK